MAKSREQTLIDDGGIRLRCAEPVKLKCPDCGDTSHSATDWESNGGTCPLGCDKSPQIICARCEKSLDALPLGDHPCRSLDVYREKGQVIFAEEMIAITEVRKRRERAERERAERERAERERAEREQAEREQAEREQAERERVERERVERERVERERVERKWQVLFSVLFFFEKLFKSKLVIFLVVATSLFVFLSSDKSATPKKDLLSQPLVVEGKNRSDAQPSRSSAQETAAKEAQKKEAELKLALSRITFTSRSKLVFRQADNRFVNELRTYRRKGHALSSNVLEQIEAGAGYLIADVDLDDDGVPEIVIKNPDGLRDPQNIYVVKNYSGNYTHISEHYFTGLVGVTNERICGFNALFDASKTVAGVIKAEPMNGLLRIRQNPCDPKAADFLSPLSKHASEVMQAPEGLEQRLRSALSVYPLAEMVPHLSQMISASKTDRKDVITHEVESIQKLPRPARGERKVARAANTAGLAAMERRAISEAVTSFLNGIKADPADQEIVDNLARALLMNRRLHEAREAALASLLLNPTRSTAWANLAAIAAENGMEDVAVPAFLLTYRFSRNQQKTIEYLERVRQEDSSARVREAAAKSLSILAAEASDGRVDARREYGESEARRGQLFRDCPECPEIVIVPSGSFEMGANDGESNEWPLHPVVIGKPFGLAKTEVTQGQWRSVMKTNPSREKACGDACPIDNVSWDDVQEYLRRLSAQTGKRYRLPSEAEWEYACRAGRSQAYCGGDSLDRVAWYRSNSVFRNHPVAGKLPNAWGLYDMTGNVAEWVEDCAKENYSGAPSDGSAASAVGCIGRIVRGGARDEDRPSPTARLTLGASMSSWRVGFRPVRVLP